MSIINSVNFGVIFLLCTEVNVILLFLCCDVSCAGDFTPGEGARPQSWWAIKLLVPVFDSTSAFSFLPALRQSRVHFVHFFPLKAELAAGRSERGAVEPSITARIQGNGRTQHFPPDFIWCFSDPSTPDCNINKDIPQPFGLLWRLLAFRNWEPQSGPARETPHQLFPAPSQEEEL